ncbi:MAG TPA: RDD family protein [Planctomycetaceae bacterium]|nr:RDD family protein [Planctomycetaceae bacterium]
MEIDRQQLDTRVQVITPENIAFQYRVAGPFPRLQAYLVDLLIRVVVCAVTLFAFSFAFDAIALGNWGLGIWYLIVFICVFFYGGLFETFWNGQTPGKRLLRIRVVSIEGQPINASQAVLRNVLRAADLQPGFCYLTGLIAAAMNDRFQRVGDLACGTMVVHEESYALRGVARVDEPEVLCLTAQLPAWFQPDRQLARALALYVGRRAQFSPSRRVQIARYVAVPLREKLGLPHQTHLDHLLCALYNRTFVNDGDEEASNGHAAPLEGADEGDSPFAAAPPIATSSPAEMEIHESIGPA